MANRTKYPATLADLEAFETELKRRIATVRFLKATMRKSGLAEVTVSGSKSLPRAYGYLDTFLHSCRKELGVP